MAFERETIDSSSDTYNVSRINGNDVVSNSIFVPIESNFTITFDTLMIPETISVFTSNNNVSLSERNKRGSIQLSSIVGSSTGTASDSLNMRALKQTSKPDFTNTIDESGTLAKDQQVSIEVEMVDAPEVSDGNSIFSFSPKVNLASNTTYFLNITPDAKDTNRNETLFVAQNGFVTNNTRSLILSSQPFKGHSISLPSTITDKFKVGESIKKKDRIRPVATVLEHGDMSSLTYSLDASNYHINVAFSATDPCVITTDIPHGLFINNKITIYDIVSGEGLTAGTYDIAFVGTDTITLQGIDTSQGTAGQVSFYINFSPGDEIVSLREDDNIQTQCISVPIILQANLEFNKEIFQCLPIGGTGNYGRAIHYDSDTLLLNYVPVIGAGSDIISSTDNFANNIVLQQTTENGIVRMFVKANTFPTQNVHPYNTSAPSVVSFQPDADDTITRTLEILNITRSGTQATVLTNTIHDLNIGDTIKIEEANQTAYNKTTTVQSIINSFQFTYEVTVSGNEPRSPATGDIIIKTGSTPVTQATAFQVQFSQSMNTSTITIANNTHLISANGTSATFLGGQDKSSSTIQLSYDNFTNHVNCKSISANTGNSLFTVVPEVLLRGKPYKIKATTDCQDLGSTNVYQNYITTNTFATGIKSINPLTGKEIIYVDNKPPKIKKISLGSLVLESSNNEELTTPENLDDRTTNLGGDDFVIQFNESMNVATVNVNSSNTDPFGTIQLSCDDFSTVVQMSAQPSVTTIAEPTDTFTFSPSHNLSSNANYTMKITKGVADDSPNKNFLENENVSSVKMMTVSDANGTFTTGEAIKGTRTMTVTTNTASVTTGITAGELILGTTSLAKGRIYDLTESDGKIDTLRYTELVSDDGNVREFQPGELVTGLSDGSIITLANSSITVAPEGKVVSHTYGTGKLIYKEANSSYIFTAGSVAANDRVTGASSNVVAKTSVTTAITNSGISTTSTALSVIVSMRKSDDSIVSLATTPTGIAHDTNVIVKFNQTMNTDTIIVNSTDFKVNVTDTVILSADNNFGNCVPLMPNPTISENGSKFEFKPVILANTDLMLTTGDAYYVKVIEGAKTKGGSNTAVAHTSLSGTIATDTYTARNASVFDNNGNEVVLGTWASDTEISTNVSKSSPIIIHFSDVLNASTFVHSAEVQLSTVSDFTIGQIACTITRTGRFGTQLIVTPNATLTANKYYLRVVAGGTNEGAQVLSATWESGTFTTA